MIITSPILPSTHPLEDFMDFSFEDFIDFSLVSVFFFNSFLPSRKYLLKHYYVPTLWLQQ